MNLSKKGLIVSCYASYDINSGMDDSYIMTKIAQESVLGGAVAIRTNLEHVSAIKKSIQVPVIGIKKIAKGDGFRITPTMTEVDQLVNAGADLIAIDATHRERYDDLTLEEFIKSIRAKYPDLGLIGDISTLEEGITAFSYGLDYVGTTLSGYTPYSKNPIVFNQVPIPEPDFEIIEDLVKNGVNKIIAEGRYSSNEHYRKALDLGASFIVVGTMVTNPRAIVKNIVLED